MTSSRRLRVSARARRDLRTILQHSAETWGREQGDAYAALLHDATHRLVEFPEVGRARDDVRPGLRGYRAGHHVVLYRVEPRAVIVVRILHARMDARRALDDSGGQTDE